MVSISITIIIVILAIAMIILMGVALHMKRKIKTLEKIDTYNFIDVRRTIKRQVAILIEQRRSPHEIMDVINSNMRLFFKKRLNLDENLTYGEIKSKFKEQNASEEIIHFCNIMEESEYSGKHLSMKELYKIIKAIDKVFNRYENESKPKADIDNPKEK